MLQGQWQEGRVPRHTCPRRLPSTDQGGHPDALEHPQAAARSAATVPGSSSRPCGRAARHAVRRRRRRGPPGPRRARNPSSNESLSYSRETQIIANNSTYGTRQSNKSTSGGGAIYGCPRRTGTKACLRAQQPVQRPRVLVRDELGHRGRPHRRPDGAAPFTTSATGVATGLNADKVDGKDAATIVGRREPLRGLVSRPARSAPSAARRPPRTAAGTYTVAFSDDISKCALGATCHDQRRPGARDRDARARTTRRSTS